MSVQVLAAVPTPFTTDGRLDTASARRLYEHLLQPATGPAVDGLLIAGSTGEFPALLDDERLTLARTALGVVGPTRVVLHIGSASAHQAAALATAAVAGGVTRLAAITPYYLPAAQARLVDYYRAVTEAAPDAEVFAYLFPERTGYQVDPATFGAIAALPGVVGAKLSGSAAGRVGEYAAVAPDAILLVGLDAGVAGAVATGAGGSITAAASSFPGASLAVARHVDAGTTSTPEGKDAQADLERIAAAAGGVGGTKAVLAARGLIGPTTRMPVPVPDAAATELLRKLADELG